jgi:2,3-bisphosphoglycerate-independent phosphoglycerate mutase
VLEALGAGIELDVKDVAVLSHFVCLREFDKCLIVDTRKPQIPEDEIHKLSREVEKYETDGVHIRFIQTKGIFGIIRLSGDVSPFITDSDPFEENQPMIEVFPWTDYSQDAASMNTAAALKDYLVWVYHRLSSHTINQSRAKKGHPLVNGFVTQRAGRLKTVTPFSKRYGLRGLNISSGMVYWGLSSYIGMDYRKVNDTEDPGRDVAERLETAIKGLNEGYDFVHVHTKAPDEAAHTKDPITKKSIIESLDRGIGRAIGPLIDDPEVFTVVTADHSTPSSGPLIHSGESVPLTFFGQGVRRDAVSRFNEVDAATGSLGNVRGKELIYLILNHLDRSKLQGIMDTPVDQPYWPGEYEPFRIKGE